MKSKSKTFYRYFLSYALVLILPVALLFLLSYTSLLNRFSAEIAESNTGMLTQMQENLDARLEQLINVAYMIQNDSVINNRTNEGDVVAARKAVQTLAVFHSVTSLPDLIITYRSGTDYCFTSTSRIRPEKLFSEQLVYRSHTAGDFLETVDRPEKIITWPADTVRQYGGQETEYLTVFITLSVGIRTPKLRTAYLIPAAKILATVSQITGEYGGTVQITDTEGNLLLGIGPVSRDDYLEAADRAAGGRIQIGGEKYLLSSAHSHTVGWDYTVLIPARVIEAPMYRASRQMILLLVVVTVLGGAAVYLFSNLHYKPWKRLTEKALGSTLQEGMADEMRQVEAVLDALSRESQSYRRTLEENQSVLLQSGLRRLLSGEYNPRLCGELESHGLALSEEGQYRVAVLECEKDVTADVRQKLESFMTSLSFGREDAVLCSSLPGEGSLAILFPNASGEDGVEDSVAGMQATLEDSCGMTVSIGLSLPCRAAEIGTAYSQAVRALQFKLVRGSGCLVVYSPELETASSMEDYPREQMEALQWHLLQLDTDSVSHMLHQILGRLQKEKVSFNMARMVCFDVVNMTVRTLHTGRGGQEGSAVRPELLEQLISFDTVPELIELLEDFVDETCASMKALQDSPKDNRAQMMKDYIEENCFDEFFSLQGMADHFSLTASNLSHYFKNCTGQGILEYVQALRKKEACRLLAETDDPVQIVGAKVGMSNVSSFIRSFKQQTGLTPGQYRKQARSGAAGKASDL